MPDLRATVGLAQIRKYKNLLLPERKRIFDYYSDNLKRHIWAHIPIYENVNVISSYYLYFLRINGINEQLRDQMIDEIGNAGVGVNVQYTPMPMLILFEKMVIKWKIIPKPLNCIRMR